MGGREGDFFYLRVCTEYAHDLVARCQLCSTGTYWSTRPEGRGRRTRQKRATGEKCKHASAFPFISMAAVCLSVCLSVCLAFLFLCVLPFLHTCGCVFVVGSDQFSHDTIVGSHWSHRPRGSNWTAGVNGKLGVAWWL